MDALSGWECPENAFWEKTEEEDADKAKTGNIILLNNTYLLWYLKHGIDFLFLCCTRDRKFHYWEQKEQSIIRKINK